MTAETKARLVAARDQMHQAQGHLVMAAKALTECGLPLELTIKHVKETVGDLAITQELLSDLLDAR